MSACADCGQALASSYNARWHRARAGITTCQRCSRRRRDAARVAVVRDLETAGSVAEEFLETRRARWARELAGMGVHPWHARLMTKHLLTSAEWRALLASVTTERAA